MYAVVILGFILMSGGASTETVWSDIFSARHIKVAPIVTFIGFISIIGAILISRKKLKKWEE